MTAAKDELFASQRASIPDGEEMTTPERSVLAKQNYSNMKRGKTSPRGALKGEFSQAMTMDGLTQDSIVMSE
jgi:hypothetical protein